MKISYFITPKRKILMIVDGVEVAPGLIGWRRMVDYVHALYGLRSSS